MTNILTFNQARNKAGGLFKHPIRTLALYGADHKIKANLARVGLPFIAGGGVFLHRYLQVPESTYIFENLSNSISCMNALGIAVSVGLVPAAIISVGISLLSHRASKQMFIESFSSDSGIESPRPDITPRPQVTKSYRERKPILSGMTRESWAVRTKENHPVLTSWPMRYVLPLVKGFLISLASIKMLPYGKEIFGLLFAVATTGIEWCFSAIFGVLHYSGKKKAIIASSKKNCGQSVPQTLSRMNMADGGAKAIEKKHSPINPPASANVNDSEKRELWNMLKERVRKMITELQGKVKQANNLSEINFIKSELIPLKTDINRLSQFSYYDEDYDEIIAADIQRLDDDLEKEKKLIEKKEGKLASETKLRIDDQECVFRNIIQIQDQEYVFIRPLGRGGMAGVSLYWHINANCYVAIKTILDYKTLKENDVDKKNEMVRRMEQEYRSLLALRGHPNVVSLISYCRTGDESGPRIIMEFVDGISLYNKLDRLSKKGYKIPPEEAVVIALQILSGLIDGYERGDQKIIHRDLTASNIILVKGRRSDEGGRVKIIDYGIAKLLIAPNAETQAGLFFGKYGYASFEQVAGKEVDYKTDIFSLGVILYEMLTGSKPYPYELPNNATPQQEYVLYYRSLEANAPDFNHLNIPDNLRPILRKMLEKNKDTRADHQEIQAALDAFLS